MRLVGYKQVSRRLGVKMGTLYAWVQAGRIPHIRLGPRSVRFDPDAVERWIDENRRAEPKLRDRVDGRRSA